MAKTITNAITSSDLSDWYDMISKEYTQMADKKAFDEARENTLIEEAVLIMHPKHKDMIVESGLSKATILWSEFVEEDKAYMVMDETLKENLRSMYGEDHNRFRES